MPKAVTEQMLLTSRPKQRPTTPSSTDTEEWAVAVEVEAVVPGMMVANSKRSLREQAVMVAKVEMVAMDASSSTIDEVKNVYNNWNNN